MKIKSMQVVEKFVLPESFGDCVEFYNFRVLKLDPDQVNPYVPQQEDESIEIVARGVVGWDTLPNTTPFGPRFQAGDAAKGSAGVYLLKHLGLSVELDEWLKGGEVVVKFRKKKKDL